MATFIRKICSIKTSFFISLSKTMRAMNASEIQNRLGENLKRIRKSRKLTQLALAVQADVSEETIKNVELCRAWPSEKTLSQITDALDTDVYALFLPTATSPAVTSRVHAKLKSAIADSVRNYVEAVLQNLTKDEQKECCAEVVSS